MLLSGRSRTFPSAKRYAQREQNSEMLINEKTRDPPKIMEWYFQALSAVMLILVTAIAQGSIQSRLEPSAWKKYQRGTVARRMDAI
jgi:hypothetical protein